MCYSRTYICDIRAQGRQPATLYLHLDDMFAPKCNSDQLEPQQRMNPHKNGAQRISLCSLHVR